MVSAGPPLRYEAGPIYYASATAENALTRLADDLDAGRRTLPIDDRHGLLPALLEALEVPVESQVLNFTKLSQQKDLVGPETPRAIYFSDDAYVGHVPGGFLEVIVSDPGLGLSFHTVDLLTWNSGGPPEVLIDREVMSCTVCHAGPRTLDVPGLLVRSVFSDETGRPALPARDVRPDHGTPLADRFGGWYVTGTTGPARHRGNLTLPTDRPEQWDELAENAAGRNVTDLSGRFDASAYRSPHSDVVALMTLEHQLDAHNRMVRTGYAYRIAAEAGTADEPDAAWRAEAEDLLAHLLFEGETPLDHPVTGTSGFAEAFAARGPFDDAGRSLRQFDLETRLFRYPCSYTVHSDGFAHLPKEVRGYLYRRLYEVTHGEEFAHLSDEDRTALREILPAVLPELAGAWKTFVSTPF
ncbi:hypothetical protein [Alienimonas sp. DA493]|uniref:hypothetical protein n=1 Tax=Alienimonas sp. DA493 TaxID=3373605 RepID=UPI003754DEDF